MTLLMIVMGIAAIVLLLVLDLVAIRRDGLGTNPPPRSHESDGLAHGVGTNSFF